MSDQSHQNKHQNYSLTPKSGMESKHSFKSIPTPSHQRMPHGQLATDLKRDSSMKTYNMSTFDQEILSTNSLSHLEQENLKLVEELKEKDNIIKLLKDQATQQEDLHEKTTSSLNAELIAKNQVLDRVIKRLKQFRKIVQIEQIFVQPLCNDVLSKIQNDLKANQKSIYHNRPTSRSTDIPEETLEEINWLKLKIQRYQEEEEAYQEKIQQLGNQNQSLRKKMEEQVLVFSSELKKNKEQIQNHRVQTISHINEINSLNNEIISLEITIGQLQQDISKMEKHHEEVIKEDENQDDSEMHEGSKEDLKVYQQHNQFLTREKFWLQKQLQQIKREAENEAALKSLISSLEERNILLYRQLQKAEDFIQNLVNTNQQLHRQLHQTQSLLSSQIEAREVAQNQVQQIKAHFIAKLKEVQQLHEVGVTDQVDFVTSLMEQKESNSRENKVRTSIEEFRTGDNNGGQLEPSGTQGYRVE